MKRGLYVLISGPSGVGKDTILRILRERFPEAVKPVNATTRVPRPGEVDGVHYHFLTMEEFRRRIASGEFLEWNEYGTGKLYGSVADAIRAQLTDGKLVMNIVDVNGARSTREKLPETATVFIAPSTFDELERRIRKGNGREGLSDDEVRKRLSTARFEMTAGREFDIIVVNPDDRVERAADELEAFIRSRLDTHGSQ